MTSTVIENHACVCVCGGVGGGGWEGGGVWVVLRLLSAPNECVFVIRVTAARFSVSLRTKI